MLAVPAAVVLAGCGTATLPTVPGVSQVDSVVTTVPAPVTSVAPPVQQAPVAAPPVVQAPVQAAPPNDAASCGGDYYINSSGNCVHRPEQAPTPPTGATAKCNDGSYSFSQHRSGTCSGHGGVATWL